VRRVAAAALCAALFILGVSPAPAERSIKPPPVTVDVNSPGQTISHHLFGSTSVVDE
jgi:hypothetical protein